MHSYIAIQNTYDVFEVALFINNQLHDSLQEDKRHASKLLVPLLDQLLTRNNITLTSLDFCAVNCGPGPFSTLRSIIASANGLHYATTIPLIGIDGLDAMHQEFYDKKYPHTIILLNAFNNDVYYCIANDNNIIAKGYKKIDAFLEDIKQQIPSAPINFIGNGISLHHELIARSLGNQALFMEPMPQYCSIKIIGAMGLQAFQKNNYNTAPLMPLHLKKHPVEER